MKNYSIPQNNKKKIRKPQKNMSSFLLIKCNNNKGMETQHTSQKREKMAEIYAFKSQILIKLKFSFEHNHILCERKHVVMFIDYSVFILCMM